MCFGLDRIAGAGSTTSSPKIVNFIKKMCQLTNNLVPQDWALTAVFPPPCPLEINGKKHLSRKPVQDFPYCVNSFPKKAGPEDLISFRCLGGCKFQGPPSKPCEEDLQTEGVATGDGSDNEAEQPQVPPADGGAAPAAVTAGTGWTFARPVQYYCKVLKEVMMASPSGTLVILTSTGCPNAAKAAAAVGFSDTRVLANRIPLHQQWHGDDLLKQHFLNEALQKAAPPVHCRTLLTSLQCITASVENPRGLAYDPWEICVDLDACQCAGLDLVYKSLQPLAAVSRDEAQAGQTEKTIIYCLLQLQLTD